MKSGVTLVELMVCLLLASMLMLMLCSLKRAVAWSYNGISSDWYCMQSLRCAFLQMDRDLVQCGYLLPGDLGVAVADGDLFVAGVPETGNNSGLAIVDGLPPYYALVEALGEGCLILDETDIDGNGQVDFWAGLGIITESGSAVIAHNYSRGSCELLVGDADGIAVGNRVVPAVHYQLGPDGLYRDGQLLAEAITGFEPRLEAGRLHVSLTAASRDVSRTASFSHALR